MLNTPPSADFCIWGTPQTAGWNSNLAIQMHLDWRQNLANGDASTSTSVDKPSRATVQWIDYVFLSCCIKKTRGIEIGVRCLFYILTPRELCWAQALTSRMIMMPSQRPQWTRVFIFWMLASAGFSAGTTCQCCHSTSFRSWLPWHNCKERE